MSYRPILLLALLLAAGTATAHHSGAMFDRSKTVTLVGTVKEYQFRNPHVWIEIMVPGKDGKLLQWSIEGEGPSGMARMGLSPKTLKSGDKVTLHAHPLRDGRNGGSFIDVKLPNGKMVSAAVQVIP
jgi:hypothetical protein